MWEQGLCLVSRPMDLVGVGGRHDAPHDPGHTALMAHTSLRPGGALGQSDGPLNEWRPCWSLRPGARLARASDTGRGGARCHAPVARTPRARGEGPAHPQASPDHQRHAWSYWLPRIICNSVLRLRREMSAPSTRVGRRASQERLIVRSRALLILIGCLLVWPSSGAWSNERGQVPAASPSPRGIVVASAARLPTTLASGWREDIWCDSRTSPLRSWR